MKAQRRHELKTNTLDAKLKKAPAFLQEYSSRILLGLVLCVLAFVLVRYYFDRKSEKAQRASDSMGEAVFALGDMATAAQRGNLQDFTGSLGKIDAAISIVLDNSEDPKIRATALVVRGDANWKAANLPPLPGATTRPELKLEKPSEYYLKAAEEAYSKVLEPPLNSDPVSVTSARLGLAAIAENRGQFDKAKEYYQKIIADPATDKTYIALAQQRMDDLSKLETPIFLSKSVPANEVVPGTTKPSTNPLTDLLMNPSTHPSTNPSIGTPGGVEPGISVPPSTQPAATRPMVPTTQPIAAPH